MALDPIAARRLAFARYVHQLGDTQSRLPEPLSAVSLLMLHDAVENLILIVADHYGVEADKFEGYWKVLKPHVPGGLSMLRAMQRLNRTRNDFKHNGVLPSAATIQMVKADVAAFMSATTQAVFNVDYSGLSMVDIVSRNGVRDILARAQKRHASGDNRIAMVHIVEAYDALFKEHKSPWLRIHTRASSPFAFGPKSSHHMNASSLARDLDIRLQLDNRRHDFNTQRIAEHIATGVEIAIASREAVRMAAIGIEYPTFLRFDSLVPKYMDMADGNRIYRAPAGYSPTDEEFTFCLDFIVSASLRLDEAESYQADPDWIQRDANGQLLWEDLLAARWDQPTPE